MKIPKYQLIAVCALLFLSVPAFSQLTSGNITGTVFDPSGATVPDATVVARNVATNVETTSKTTGSGGYRFENLPIGTYNITVTAGGFNKAEIDGVTVELNQTITTNATLTIGQAATAVEVTESVAAIDTTTAQVQTTFQAKQLADLPSASSGSGVINLSLLNAGVTTSGGLGYGVGPSVGGQRPNNNNFTVEGIDNNNLGITGPIVTIPNDAVSEFSVLQNQFSPDFGHSSGGQFNQVVKSGSNSFHGMAYEYFQNRNLDAADNLNFVLGNPLHPRSDTNRFGGNFGGPIKRNKLFFFVDYEYQPSGGTSSLAYYAPTAAGYAKLAALPINQTNLAQFQKYLGTATTAANPASLPNGAFPVVASGPGSSQSLGTGVFAPHSTTSPITIPVGQISTSPPSYSNTEYGVASIDYNISDKDSLRGRFILNRQGLIDNTGFPAAFYTTLPVNAYLATFSEYHTFSPTLLNEFRFGYNRYNQQYTVTNQTFPGLDAFPNINVYELNAAFGPDPNAPQYTIQNLYQLTDNVTWTKGNHSFKFGFDGWNAISPTQFIQRSRGDYEWSYLNDYLYDYNPDGIAQRSLGHNSYYQNQQLYGFFANDNWKIRPNLTLNLGLRYEYLTIPVSQNEQALNASASVPGLIVFNKPKSQTDIIMPRVGFAYSPGVNGKTSIRAGFGITYDVLYDNLGTLSLPPQLNTTVDVTGVAATGFLAGGGIPSTGSVTPPEGAAARAVTSGFIPDQKRPAAYNWNFSIQRQFGGNYVFESRYLGTRGLFLPVQMRLNIQPVVNASNALPVYFSAPSQATLNALPNTLTNLQTAFDNGGLVAPAWANAGFTNTAGLVGFMPQGNSIYHGWSNQLSRRFSNGLQFQGSYTWSHNIDDSTASVNTTVLAPRRPEDFQDLRIERASSILDYRNRIVLQMLYDVPFFKNRSWWLKNVIGNWEISPVYTYQSGQHVTPQSAVDSNLNGDSAPDRVIINPSGNIDVGTGATALANSAGDTVAYLADNPNARFVQAPKGTLPDAGRSLLNLNPIDNIDLTIVKRINITERFKVEFSARAINILNHPQYTGGYLSDASSYGGSAGIGSNGGYAAGALYGDLVRPTLQPQSTIFQQWSQAFSSNPRSMQLALKLTF